MFNAYFHPTQKTIAIIPNAPGMASKQKMIQVGYTWIAEYDNAEEAEKDANEVLELESQYFGIEDETPDHIVLQQINQLLNI